jgi:hypothetical protein
MLQMIPGLEAHLMDSLEEEIVFIADLVNALLFMSVDASSCNADQEGLSQHKVQRHQEPERCNLGLDHTEGSTS